MGLNSMMNLSKSTVKRAYKNFWKGYWVYGRSPELWVNLYVVSHRDKDRIHNALVKLTLEKRITPEQKEDLLKMLKSSDHENIYMAISIMAGVAPKRFQRRERNRQ